MNSKRLRLLALAATAQAVVRVFGLARDYLLARWIGFGPSLDPYFLAFSVLVIALGVVTSVVHIGLVPAFARGTVVLTDSRARSLLALGAGVALLGAGATRVVNGSWVAVILLLAVVPAACSTALSARLVASDRQVAAVLPGLSLAVVPIAGAMLLGRTVDLDDLVGLVLLAYLGELTLQWWAARREYVCGGAGLRGAFNANVIRGLGGASLITTAWSAVDLGFVRALGETSVSIYSLAVRVPQGLGGVVLPAVTNVLLPAASRAVSRVEDFRVAWPAIRRSTGVAFGVGAALAVANLVLALGLERFAFANSAVSASQSTQIFRTQAALGMMLPAYVAGLVLVRYFQAAGHHRPILTIGVATLAVNGIANWVLSREFGVEGVAVATVVAYLFSFVLLLVVAVRAARPLEVPLP